MATTVSLLRDHSTAGPENSFAAFVFCGGDEEDEEEEAMMEEGEGEEKKGTRPRRRHRPFSTSVALSHAGLVAPGDSIPGAEEAEESGGLLRGHGTRSSGVDVVAAAAAAAGGGRGDNSSTVSALPSSPSSGKGLFATVAGQVTRVDRLVRVSPATFSSSLAGGSGGARYSADVGDVVVGRVIEVSGKRWRVDLGGKHDAALALSAVSLPVVFDSGGADGERMRGGGDDDDFDDEEDEIARFAPSTSSSAAVAVAVARRRGAEDEASMREVLREGDLLSAEVQAVHAGDGSLLLHARSSKYGKLKSFSSSSSATVKSGDQEESVGGQLVRLPASSVGRQRQQFCELTRAGVEVILGVNGWVWVSPLAASSKKKNESASSSSSSSSLDRRRAVAVASAALRALASLGIPVTPRSIERAVGVAVSGGFTPLAMIGSAEEYLLAVARAEREARSGGGV